MKIVSLLTLTAALSLCACDSKQEQAREKALENRADNLEKKADAIKETTDRQVDAAEKKADAHADALKKEADLTREQK